MSQRQFERRYAVLATTCLFAGAAAIVRIGLVAPSQEYRETCKPIHSLGGFVFPVGDKAHLAGRAGVCSVEFFDGGHVSDEALASLLPHLESLSGLRRLQLWDQPISDRSLKGLKRLSQLESLELHGTNCTQEGIEQFRCDMPNCVIVSDFAVAD